VKTIETMKVIKRQLCIIETTQFSLGNPNWGENPTTLLPGEEEETKGAGSKLEVEGRTRAEEIGGRKAEARRGGKAKSNSRRNTVKTR